MQHLCLSLTPSTISVVIIIRNVARHCQMSPGGQSCPGLRADIITNHVACKGHLASPCSSPYPENWKAEVDCGGVLWAPTAHSCQGSGIELAAESFQKALCCCSGVKGEETCPYQLWSDPCSAGVGCSSVALSISS